MPLPTAEGCISTLEDLVATRLSELAAFQAWLGVASSTAALDKIYFDVVPYLDVNERGEIEQQAIKDIRPFAQVYMPDNGLDKDKNSSSPSTQTGANQRIVEIKFEQGLSALEIDELPSASRTFKNHIGKIFTALFAACNAQPDMRKLTMVSAPQCSSKGESAEEGEDIMFAKFIAYFGTLA